MSEQPLKKANGTFKSAFLLLIMLFFMWGFITSLNDILIPHLKGVFDLNYTEAMLVQFCFFGSYFIMSVPSSRIIERFGYTKGIVIGLVVMGLGCLLFYPAAAITFYPLFLLALFILASGITMLQVAANPFVAAVGNPETASSRLNLSQGFNGIAHTIAPIFGTYLILADNAEAAPKIEAVQLPYIGLAITLFVIAVLFSIVKLPNIQNKLADVATQSVSIWSHKHLLFGVAAIFLYVGIEVSIGGFLVSFLGEENIAGMKEEIAGNFVSYYWGGAMIGRFVGSALLQKMKANLLLAISSIGALVLVFLTIVTEGNIAMWSVLIIGLFNSVMFANIFTLSIKGLGSYTSRGSGMLVMAIVGGAIVPLFQGMLADSIGIQLSFAIGFICYGYILFYALRGYKIEPITASKEL